MVQSKRNSICLFYPPLQLQVFAVLGIRSSSYTADFLPTRAWKLMILV